MLSIRCLLKPLPSLVLLLCLLASQVAALDPGRRITQHSHRLWTTDHGLPQNTVRAIVQTPDGFLWFGTKAGLVRFDGLLFRIYDRSTTPAMSNHHIYALTVTADGVLWVGTNGGGLLRYIGGKFTAYGVADGLPTGRVTALAEGTEGDLWIGTYGGGLARLRQGRIEVFDQRHGLTEPVIFTLASDGEGGVWIGTYGGGVFRFSDGAIQPLQAIELPDPGVWSLHRSEDGLWIGTDRGLVYWAADGEKQVYDLSSGLAHQRILSVLEDRDGVVWIGTYGGGLHRLANGRLDRLTRDVTYSSDKIWSLFEDREGSVWFGTLGGGLNQLTDGIFTSWSVEEGLPSELISGIAQDADGAIWLGSRDRGLVRFVDGEIDHITTADGLAHNGIMDVMSARDGVLWVAHHRAGVSRLHNGKWSTYGVADGLAHVFANTMAEGLDGDIWIGTNGGLSRWDGAGFTIYRSPDGLPSEQIRDLHVDRDGMLWVGSLGGLSRLTKDGFETFTTADGLSSNNVWSIHEDEDAEGMLWLGTVGGGLNRFWQGEIATITSRDGLYDDELAAVQADDYGNIWMCSSRGAFRASRDHLVAFIEGRSQRVLTSVYGRRDGMKSNECQAAAGLKSRDGRLWFATLQGVSVADPKPLPLVAVPQTLIDEVRLDNQAMSPTWDGRISPGPHRLKISFSAPTMSSPQRTRMRYQLQGMDDSWIEAAGRRSTIYGNLPPGEYTFRAMASDELGRWVGEEVQRRVVVLPGFGQTPAFYALCVLAAVAIGWGFQVIRVRRLQRRELELMAKVDKTVLSLRMLRGLLPICAGCKKIRGDRGYWQELEAYIDQHSEATFTHGLCPTCATDMLAEVDDIERMQDVKME